MREREGGDRQTHRQTDRQTDRQIETKDRDRDRKGSTSDVRFDKIEVAPTDVFQKIYGSIFSLTHARPTRFLGR